MSLEDALAANTAAVEKHTALLEKVLASGGAKAGSTAKELEEKAPAKASAKAPAKAPAKGKSKKQPWDDPDTFLAAFGEFLDKAGDKAERSRLGSRVKMICEAVGAERVSEVDADQRETAYGYLQELIGVFEEDGLDAAAEHKFTFPDRGDEEEEEEEEESPL